nr:hypothetical protein [Tanacetum cinerariifolium]
MMGEVDIDTLTIEKYLMLTQGNQAQSMMKRLTWRNARSYDKNRVLGYENHFDDSKINAYYDLPPLLPCFKPVQPYTKDRHEPLKEDTDFVSEDELEIGACLVYLGLSLCLIVMALINHAL